MKTLANIRLSAFCMFLATLAFTGCNPSDCCNTNLFGTNSITITLDGKGSPKLLDITCPLPWILQTALPPWLQMTPTSGSTSTTTITFSANPNPGSRSRTVALTLLADNGNKLTINVIQSTDPLLDFKANDRPRWEDDAIPVVEYNDEHPYIYINEQAGSSLLFKSAPSSKYKAGRIKVDEAIDVTRILGFEIIGFDTPPTAVGIYDGCLYTPGNYAGATLFYLEVVKIVGDKLWIVFKVNNGDPERRIVQ